MKYLKKFNESDMNIASLVGDMVADINDDYPWMITSVEERDNEGVVIGIRKNEGNGISGYVNLEIVLNKMNQILEQIPDYEIVKVALYFIRSENNKSDYSKFGPYQSSLPDYIGPNKSYVLFKDATSANIKVGIKQGFTGCDRLSRINNYININYRHVSVVLGKKKQSKVRKFFNFLTK